MFHRVSLRWLAAIAVLPMLLGIGTINYAQIAKDKGIEAAQFTIEGKETVRLKIYAILPEGTKIEVTIGQNKITFTWTAEEVKQGFLDTGHLELAGSEIFVKLLYEKTPNECRIPVGEVPKQSYKAFCKLRPAFFSVTGLDLPSSARINTSVSIMATIKNTGEESGAKDVWLEIDGREVERQRDVRLAPNESTTVRFTRSFSSAGRYSVRVATPDDARSSTLSIESRPAYFYVGSVSTSPSSPFPVNTTATFSALIENRGDETGTKPVWLEIDGSRVRETTLTLRPGQSDTVRFSYTFTSSGRYTARIRSPDDSSSTEVTVQARPAYFQVSSCSIPSSANVNQSVTFSARITNTGGSSGSQYIRLLIDGSRVDSKYVSLGPGSSETVYFYRTFSYTGSYSVRIESDDDYCYSSITIRAVNQPPPWPLTETLDLKHGDQVERDPIFESASDIKVYKINIPAGATLTVQVRDCCILGDIWRAEIYESYPNLKAATEGDGSENWSFPAQAVINSGVAYVVVKYVKGVDKWGARMYIRFKVSS